MVGFIRLLFVRKEMDWRDLQSLKRYQWSWRKSKEMIIQRVFGLKPASSFYLLVPTSILRDASLYNKLQNSEKNKKERIRKK